MKCRSEVSNVIVPITVGSILGLICPYKIDEWQWWVFILLANFLAQPLISIVSKWISN